jgi:hypothetical protein
LQLLQETKLIEVWKGTRNNRPSTLVKLTDLGRKRFLEYIAVLEGLVADALSTGSSPAAGRSARGTSPRLSTP